MSIFATRLKELRGTESQAAFSASIGINRVQYAKYESGQNSPSVEVLEKICRTHDGVSADWLLGIKDDTPKESPRTAASQPGELPACSKCPIKKKLEKLEAVLAK